MKKIPKCLAILTAFVSSASVGCSQDAKVAFAEKAKAAADAALAAKEMSVAGDDKDWLFLTQELSHVGLGQFWTDFSKTASKKDPRPVIEAYHKALKEKGVRLIVVPVPPKAVIYPKEFWSDAGDVFMTSDFYKPLTAAGVEVIDLEPVLMAERKKEGGEKLYCEQDSHPSPYTCKLMAELIAEKLGDAAAKPGAVEEESEDVKGDLSGGSKETLKVWKVPEAVEPTDKASPVVVVGDSHTLIFQAGGDMLSTQSGMVDHLQNILGHGVYLQANKGSGIDAARGNLARVAFSDAEFWKDKKAVVWCFGARMFTQERQWREIPVGR